MVIFTIPPPASPTTSMFAISAWAFCMFACMAWACFIRLLKLPRMESLTCGAARHRCSPNPHFTGRTVSGSTLAPMRLRRGFSPGGRTGLEFEPHARAEMARQRLRQLLLGRHGAYQLVARIEPQTHQGALAAEEHTVARKLPRGSREFELRRDCRPA